MLVVDTIAQGHSLECASRAVYPPPGEELNAPECIDDGGFAWVQMRPRILERD